MVDDELQEGVAGRLGLVVEGSLQQDAGSRCELQGVQCGPVVQPSPWSGTGARAVSVELCKNVCFWKLRKLMIRSPANGSMSRRIAQ